MNKWIKGICAILAFSGSFLLASYFSNNGVILHEQANKTASWVDSLINDAPEIIIPAANTEKTPAIIKPIKSYKHVEVGNAITCKDTSIGAVQYKKIGDVYTWIDERGIANFSSTPPQKGEFELLNYAGEKVFDYFSLDLNTESLPYDFNQKLTVKLNKLFEIYGQLLDRSSLKKIGIKLRIYESKAAFNQVKAKYNVSLSDNTRGFYSHINNQAHLLFTDNEETLSVATHEATHAINRGVIGYTPRWLNEGLAEVSESIEIEGKIGLLSSSKDWTNNHYFLKNNLPLSVLFSARQLEWNGESKISLYATSWAFVYFMLEQPQRKAMLAKLIQYEQKNLCDEVESKDIERVIGMPVNTLQSQFTRWLKNEIKPIRV